MKATLQLIAFIVFATVTCSYGQNKPGDEYIVTAKNDTLHGQVKFRSDSVLIFKNINFQKQIFMPDKINAVFADDKYYTSENVAGKKKFLQEVLKGHMSLYRYRSVTAGERLYLKKNDTIYVVNSRNYVGLVGFFLNSCQPEEALTEKKIRNKYKYTMVSMIDFVSAYNSCKGHSVHQIIKDPHDKIKVIAINAGVDMHQLKLGSKNDTYPGKTFGKNLGYTVGVSLGRAKRDGFMITPGIRFTYKTGSADKIHFPLNDYTFVDIDLKLRHLEVPVMFRYTFKGKNVKPFVFVSPFIGTSTVSKIKRTPYKFTYNDTIDFGYGALYITYGIGGGAGIYLPNIMKGIEFSLSTEKSLYDYRNDMKNLQSTSLRLGLGFYLKK